MCSAAPSPAPASRSHAAHGPALRPGQEGSQALTLGFFGTSITEHLEAFNAQMTTQANLPAIGSTVTVEGWHQRGWVHRLVLALRASRPDVRFDVHNLAEGGATSRDIASIVDADLATDSWDGTGYDLVFLSCGINDVWRHYQGRTSEAVGIQEYTRHLQSMLARLTARSRRVVVISQTPFGPIEDPGTVASMNADLAGYNTAAKQVAALHGAAFLDVWAPFTSAARHLPADDPAGRLWGDGIHLSELGDTILLQQAERFLTEHQIIEELTSYSSQGPDSA